MTTTSETTVRPYGPVQPLPERRGWRTWWTPLADDADVWGLTANDRWLLSRGLVVFAVLLALHGWKWSAEAQRPLTVIAAPRPAGYEFRVEMNSATWIEWSQLDGIGGTLARRIVADRESRGRFQSIDDIARVKGIGPKTLEKLRPHLYLAPTPETISTPDTDSAPTTIPE